MRFLSSYPNYDYQPKNKKGPDGKPVVAAKPPKRQAGSKAALKAQAAQAAREKKAADNAAKDRAMQMNSGGGGGGAGGDSDEDEERSGSGTDDDEYIRLALLHLPSFFDRPDSAHPR